MNRKSQCTNPMHEIPHNIHVIAKNMHANLRAEIDTAHINSYQTCTCTKALQRSR